MKGKKNNNSGLVSPVGNKTPLLERNSTLKNGGPDKEEKEKYQPPKIEQQKTLSRSQIEEEDSDDGDDHHNLEPRKLINFDEKLKEMKEKSRVEVPFTLTQTEDAMYIDQGNIVTLEYHYYQNNCKYTKLLAQDEQFDDDGKLVNMNQQPVSYMLATEQYEPKGEPIHPMSGFDKENITNYVDQQIDIIKKLKYQKSNDFMRVEGIQNSENEEGEQSDKDEKKEKQAQIPSKANINNKKKKIMYPSKIEHQMVEVVLALYKITQKGKMQRILQAVEQDVKIGRKFFKSENGNMVLTRSTNKLLISLVNFDRNNKYDEYFKLFAWSSKMLKAHQISERLNYGLNGYFRRNQLRFHELVEVQFVGKNDYVLLKYIEIIERKLSEMQEYEQKLESYRRKNKKSNKDMQQHQLGSSNDPVQNYEKRTKPRLAVKYVFFNAITGEVEFEYGGFKDPITAKTKEDKLITIYELGVLVKEIREQQFNPQFVFFFAGDFMDPRIQKNQLQKWAFATINIDFTVLLKMGSQEKKDALICEYIQNHIYTKQEKYVNYYPFDQTWIEQNKYDWEINIKITANRDFSQIGLINTPQDKAFGHPSILIHGPRFESYLDPVQDNSKELMLTNPFFQRYGADVDIIFARNQNIKDQIFYEIVKKGEVKTMCL